MRPTSFSPGSAQPGYAGLDQEPDTEILNIARILIAAGWDGENQEPFTPTPLKTLQGYHVEFKIDDFPKIQEVVRAHLHPRQQSSESGPAIPSRHVRHFSRTSTENVAGAKATEESSPVNETGSYAGQLELLRKHLNSLGNPYLVRTIYGKLETFLGRPIDVSEKEKLAAAFEDENLPLETRGHFKAMLSSLVDRATADLDQLDEQLREIRKDIQELTDKLKQSNAKILQEYEGWEDLERLLSLPACMAMKDLFFRKLMKVINQEGPDQLRDYVKMLGEINNLNVAKLNEQLTASGYEYDLDTLLGEIIEKKPKNKEGIVTYWHHPVEFFTDKTIYITDTSGKSYYGVIVRCKRNADQTLTFTLQDKTEITVPPRYRVRITEIHSYKLWTAILNGTLTEGEVFTLEHAQDTDHSDSVDPGRYKLVKPKFIKGGLLSDDSYQFELWDAATDTQKYLIKGDLRSNAVYQMTVQTWNPAKRKFVKHEMNKGYEAFNRSHLAAKRETYELTGIDETNAEELVIIKDEPNDDKEKLRRLAQVKQQFNEILTDFLGTQNQELLEELLDNFHKNSLQSIDPAIVDKKNPELARKLKALSQKYYDALMITRTVPDILKQVILEANYVRLVHKTDNIVIARTMALLKDAYLHIDLIHGKPLVLVMGNTGSGKSTAISALMGAPLQEFVNQVGETVVEIPEDRKAKYPKIGQSIGTSETIYTQGFPLPNTEVILGDCPGFNDTRGGDYELCTNLSIDQAVAEARAVQSVVVVLPANAFLVDKGNVIIELVNTVRERFPRTLDIDNIEQNERVFLLITKQNQAQSEVVRKLKDGTRFKELVNEAQRQIDDLQRGGADLDSFEVQSLLRRQKVWKAIQQMHLRKKIDFIDTKNQRQKIELTKKYTEGTPPLDKKFYAPAMAGDYMHKKFGDTVQMSAHTWSQLIFDQYLKTIPEAIEVSRVERKKKEDRLVELQGERELRLKSADALGKEMEDYAAFIAILKQHGTQVVDAELRQQLLAKAAQHSNDKLDREKAELIATDAALERKNEKLRQTQAEIVDLEARVADTQGKIDRIKASIQPLEVGEKVTLLYHHEFHPEYEMGMRVWKSDQARDDAYRRGYEQDSDYDPSKAYKIKAKDLRGKTASLAFIERQYRLVPSDPAQRDIFLATGQGGGYIARVDGLRYRIDKVCRPMPDGKKIAYGYEFDWDGGQMPWIKITHTIPNHEYYYATIVNLKAELDLLEKALITLNKQLNGGETITGAKQTKRVLEAEIQDLNQKKAGHAAKIKQLEDELASEQAMDLLIETQKKLEEAKVEKAKLEDTKVLDEKIANVKLEIEAEKKNGESLQIKLRNLAIIIVTQWDSVVLLRKFADLVVGPKTSEITQTNSTIESCEAFIRMFDEKKEEILTKIKAAHGF